MAQENQSECLIEANEMQKENMMLVDSTLQSGLGGQQIMLSNSTQDIVLLDLPDELLELIFFFCEDAPTFMNLSLVCVCHSYCSIPYKI